MAKKNTTTSVITGDIINSRQIKNSGLWLTPLKKILSSEGNSPGTWEVYRGDSFQIEINDPPKAFLIALKIKATIKCIKDLDVRMAIGIGKKDFVRSKITESNGEAFINSGEKLETLKKEKQNLAIKSAWPEFDKEINLCIRLALIAMDNWTTGAAQLIKILIDNQDITQSKLAKKLKISQSSVSEKKKRAFYSEIMELESFYQEKIKNLILLYATIS
jgi:predicted XRE-type DNA-binding protein